MTLLVAGIVSLLVWALGLGLGFGLSGFIHLFLVAAVVFLLFWVVRGPDIPWESAASNTDLRWGAALAGVDQLSEELDAAEELADELEDELAVAEARIVELEARLGPKPWCPECGHPLASFHEIIGCQHLIPVYVNKRLLLHDKCRCRCKKVSQTATYPGWVL